MNGKNFRAQHEIFLREIEHVEGAAVAEKSFFVVAVKIFYLRGVGGAVQKIFQKLQAGQLKGGRRERFFFQIKLSQRESAIDFSVDQKFFCFGENFLRDEKKFQVGANQFVVSGRRSIFLPLTPQTKFCQTFGQNKNFRAETQPNPHQIIGQLPKAVHVQKFKFFVGLAANHRAGVAKTIRVIKKIIQPLGTRAVVLVENIFVIVFGVRLFKISLLVDELNPREARRKIFTGVEEGDLLFQFFGSPKVVGVVHGDIFSPRTIHGLANRDVRAAVFLV